MSDYTYRICREPRDTLFYIERHLPGDGTCNIADGFKTVAAAQTWIDENRQKRKDSNFYSGDWQ